MMKIVEVTPISKGVFKENLTYFTTQDVAPGMIVEIPLKNKVIEALVISCRDGENLKAEIKKSDFGFKKLGKIKNTDFFLPEFIQATREISRYFVCPIGSAIKDLTPQIILDNVSQIKNVDSNFIKTELLELQVVQEPEEERLSFYKSLIREAFAKKQSVFWCLPTLADVENIQDFITKGIEQYVIVLHNKLPKNQLVQTWKKALMTEHPLLIIATPMFLSLPRRDIETIIVDKENSTAYKNFNRPFLDYRLVAEFLAKQRKIRFILGDTALRTETIYRVGRGELLPASPLKYRIYSESKQYLAKMIYEKNDDSKTSYLSLSEQLIWQIENSHYQNERLFVFAGRRGLAPVTVCSDCGKVVACDICNSPLAIHKKTTTREEQRLFVCHKCSQMVEIEDKCANCGGWRLATLGYGTEKIEEEIKNHFPELNVFRIDSDTVKNNKKAREIAKQFYSSPGSVLIGTEMALNYLSEKIENVAVASIDTFLALPDFRISEKLFNILLKLRLLANKKFLIQTRNPEEKIFELVTTGNLIDYFREEIAERKQLGYPPFKIIIKITREGRRDEVKKDIENLAKQIESYKPIVFPSLFVPKIAGKYSLNILIKLESNKWIDESLLTILKSLPPTFVINVDPENIL